MSGANQNIPEQLRGEARAVLIHRLEMAPYPAKETQLWIDLAALQQFELDQLGQQHRNMTTDEAAETVLEQVLTATVAILDQAMTIERQPRKIRSAL